MRTPNTNPTTDAPRPGVSIPDQMGHTTSPTTGQTRGPTGGEGGTKSTEKLRQPNERDESPDNGRIGVDGRTDVPQRQLRQAHDDVEQGQVNTDRRGVPSDVPSSKDNDAK